MRFDFPFGLVVILKPGRIHLFKKHKPKLKKQECPECLETLPLKDFPKHLEGGLWVRNICWECLENEEDGYVIQVC